MKSADEQREAGVSPSRVPGFRTLAGSYAINELGDTLGVVALAVLVMDRTSSVAAVTALFLVGRFVPAIMAPLVTSRLAQLRVSRSLPALYAIEAVCFGALAMFAGRDDFLLGAVLALALVDGLLAVTARGLSRGAIAGLLVPHGALRRGNAFINIIFAVVGIAGAVLAVWLIELGGAEAALWIDAATFVAAGVVLLSTRTGLPAAEPDENDGRGWWRRTVDGVGHVWGQPRLRRLVAGQGAAVAFFALIVPIEVVYARESIGAGSVGYGWLMASWGVGILIGSVAFSRPSNTRLARLVVIATILIGAGYAGLAAAPGLLVACAASVVGGVGNGLQWVTVMTLLQETVDERFRARAAGLLESIAAGIPGVAYLTGGALTAVSGPRTAYAIAACGIVLVAIYWLARPLGSDTQGAMFAPADAGDGR